MTRSMNLATRQSVIVVFMNVFSVRDADPGGAQMAAS